MIRSLQNDDTEAYGGLCTELTRRKRDIDSDDDVQLQTLLVRCIRKSKQKSTGAIKPLEEAVKLIEMIK